MKHQQLYQRTAEVLETSCGHGFGRYSDTEKVALTGFVKAVVAYPLLPRVLLLAAFELGTQRHYVESIRALNGAASDPLYVDDLKNHWIEESQHVKLDLLEAARLAADMTSDDISRAFDDVLDLGGIIGHTNCGAGRAGADDLRNSHRTGPAKSRRSGARDALDQSLQAIVARVSLTHPDFKQFALELSKQGAAKLGIVV